MIRLLSFLIDGCRAVPCRCTKCGKLGMQKDKSGGVG